MITRQQIIRKADEDGVPAPTVERDYVLAHCLSGIASVPQARGLIFKGGSALRMCYVAGFRYSADLDFSLAAEFPRLEALQIIGRGLESVKQTAGFPKLDLVSNDVDRIEYEGPLGRVRWIKLDLDEDELVFSLSTTPFLRRYDDLTSSEGLPTYSLPEIAAEKLRCIIQRLQCRDFFDLHHLLEVEGVDLDETWEMFEAKARHKGIDPGVFSAASMSEFRSIKGGGLKRCMSTFPKSYLHLKRYSANSDGAFDNVGPRYPILSRVALSFNVPVLLANGDHDSLYGPPGPQLHFSGAGRGRS